MPVFVPVMLSTEPSKPASVAGSEPGGGGKKPQGLGEWKADFEDAGSVALSSASHPSQAKKSKAGTAATTDSEVSEGRVVVGGLTRSSDFEER